MHYHLNSGDNIESQQKEKMQITELIYQMVNRCDPNKCLGYKRKQIELLENKTEKYLQKKQNRKHSSSSVTSCDHNGQHLPFYVSCMDTIHCYFMHFPSTKLQQQSMTQ